MHFVVWERFVYCVLLSNSPCSLETFAFSIIVYSLCAVRFCSLLDKLNLTILSLVTLPIL